jgi:ATP adenylyltransferase
VIHRGGLAFCLLNKYPYSSGHVMVRALPARRRVGGLSDGEALEIHTGSRRMALDGAAAGRPSRNGFNLGWNIGRAAGAGVIDQRHLHAVPRWGGDTNFMPVLADVKVLRRRSKTREEARGGLGRRDQAARAAAGLRP